MGQVDTTFLVEMGMALPKDHGIGGTDVWDWSIIWVVRSAPYSNRDMVSNGAIGNGDNAIESDETNGLI